jgi:non-specific serine/threonine protein kinase
VGEGRRWLAAVLAVPVPAAPPATYLAARAEAAFGANVLARVAGDAAAARAAAAECLALWRGLGDEDGVAWALATLGEMDLFGGDYRRAQSRLEASVAAFRRLGNPVGVSQSLLSLGLAAAGRGDPARARAALDESVATYRALGERRGLSLALAGLGRVTAMGGDHRGAWSSLRESLSLQRDLVDRADAAETLEWCAGLAAVRGQTERAARLAGAAGALRAAREVAWAVPVGRDLLERWLGAARRALGEDAFEAARAAGQALPLEEAIADVLASEGRAAPPPAATPAVTGPRASPWSPLTEREGEVAVLVAQGLTNREIGERLVITPGTAGVHVVHILNKLGLRSRTQIASWATAQGFSSGDEAREKSGRGRG